METKEEMAKVEAREAAKVMLISADGKDIEYRDINDSTWRNVIGNLVFDWSHNDYRIKQGSTYRPFKDKDECWAEMQKHQPFGWVKNTGFLTCLTSIGDTTDFNYSYEVLCFADGTPFGIKVDDYEDD